MTKAEAYLIIRLADAISEEGIWHHVDRDMTEQTKAGDAALLMEAARLAWDLLTPAQREGWNGSW